MSRRLFCAKCDKIVGVVMNGSRLKNGMAHLCRECWDQVKLDSETVDTPTDHFGASPSFPDIFKNLFGKN